MSEPIPPRQSKGTELFIQLKSGDFVNFLLVRYFTPFQVGIGITIAGILFIFLADSEEVLYCPNHPKTLYNLGYLYNFSWSASMIILFPVISGLIVYYYQSLPQFVDRLFLDHHNSTLKRDFVIRVQNSFNLRVFVAFIFTFGIAIQWLYFKDLQDSSTWVWEKCLAPGISKNFHWQNMTVLGWCAALMQLVFTFIFLLFLFRAIAFSVAIKKLLEKEGFDNAPIPFHPDGTCGYGFFRERIFLTLFIVSLLGIYVALYMFDKLNQESELSLAVTFLFITFYFLFGGTIVAFSFLGAHIQMQKAKQKLLDPIGRSIKQHLEIVGNTDVKMLNKEELEVISRLKILYQELNNQIPEWPLNLRSLTDIFQGLIVPMVPAILAFVGRFIK